MTAVEHRFGPYGGQYVPETLMPALEELEAAGVTVKFAPEPAANLLAPGNLVNQMRGVDLALVHKTRPRGSHNEVKALHVVGDVEGRHCVLIDDMIDTAGTICAAAELLAEAGAAEISVMATHALLSDPAVDRLKAAPISRVVVTDTLPVAEDRYFDKLEILSVAKIIADAIDAVFEDTSVSELFGGDNLV